MERLSDRWMFYCGLLVGMNVSVEDLKHIQDLIDAEEQGLLVKLPCKVGDALYDIYEFVHKCSSPEMYVLDASKIEISKDEKGWLYTIDSCDFREKDFGIEIFASKEEAEAKLRELQSEVAGNE